MMYNSLMIRTFRLNLNLNKISKICHFVMFSFIIIVYQSNLKQNGSFKSVKFKSTWCKVQVVKSCQYNEKRNKSL